MSRMIIVALAAALAIVPAAAEAQETITACYVPKSGSVYRIQVEGTPSECKSSHVQFSWTADGGSQPVFAQRFSSWKVIPVGTADAQTSTCDEDETVVGGGYFLLMADEVTLPLPGEVLVLASVPRVSPAQGWAASVHNQASQAVKLQVWAVCSASAT